MLPFVRDTIEKTIEPYLIRSSKVDVYDYGICGVIEEIVANEYCHYVIYETDYSDTEGFLTVLVFDEVDVGTIDHYFYEKELNTFGL